MIVKLPKHIPMWYENNPQTGYYTKTPHQPLKEPCLALPYELRVEQTHLHEIKTQAKQIIRSKERNEKGKYTFFTGMVRVKSGVNCFVGNRCCTTQGRKTTELIIFCFSEDNSSLWVFYFPGFDKGSIPERVRFARQFTRQLLAQFA